MRNRAAVRDGTSAGSWRVAALTGARMSALRVWNRASYTTYGPGNWLAGVLALLGGR